MSMTGKIATSFTDSYGFIEPDDGTDRVIVHADEFGAEWPDVKPGTAVRFSSLQGARGLRAYNVRILAL
jgi:cold shock protein